MARCMVNSVGMRGEVEAYGPGLRSLGLQRYIDAGWHLSLGSVPDYGQGEMGEVDGWRGCFAPVLKATMMFPHL